MEKLFSIITFDNSPGFNVKAKVSSISASDLFLERNFYLDCENNEREELNRSCDFVCGKLFKYNDNDSEVVQEINDNRHECNRLEKRFVR